ncbi:MAG: hypothetical protein FP820_02535 [Sulfurimonas sp.]|jgi:hypothetical protein|nr:hypothetical protein [Sulfurimonas sp.]MBU3938048.1 hypothetical protein [bacterium]MBU4024137.1 hypothetical protein [bacterium]
MAGGFALFGGFFTMLLAYGVSDKGIIHTLVIMLIGLMGGASFFFLLGSKIEHKGKSIPTSDLKMNLAFLGTAGTTYLGYTYYGEGFVDTLIGTLIGFIGGFIIIFIISQIVIGKDSSEKAEDELRAYKETPEYKANQEKKRKEEKRKEKAQYDAECLRINEVYQEMYDSVDRRNMSEYEIKELREKIKSRADDHVSYREKDIVKQYTEDILAGRMTVIRDVLNNRIGARRHDE